MTVEEFAEKYSDERDELALRQVEGVHLTQVQFDRLQKLNAIYMGLLPKPRSLPQEVNNAIAEVRSLWAQWPDR